MHCVLVIAHPLQASLCRHFADTASARLEAAGHAVRILDLYGLGFDPRLTRSERQSYYAEIYDISQVEDHARALRAADTLVFVFPTWWFGMPAILKGWIDRVFAPTVAFAHGEDFGPIRPLLTNLRNIVAITTLGSPWWLDWFVMRRPVRRIFRTALFGACAPQARLDFLSLYEAEKPSPARVRRFEARITRAMAKIG
jgi:putative NADPH-quinone reductase